MAVVDVAALIIGIKGVVDISVAGAVFFADDLGDHLLQPFYVRCDGEDPDTRIEIAHRANETVIAFLVELTVGGADRPTPAAEARIIVQPEADDDKVGDPSGEIPERRGGMNVGLAEDGGKAARAGALPIHHHAVAGAAGHHIIGIEMARGDRAKALGDIGERGVFRRLVRLVVLVARGAGERVTDELDAPLQRPLGRLQGFAVIEDKAMKGEPGPGGLVALFDADRMDAIRQSGREHVGGDGGGGRMQDRVVNSVDDDIVVTKIIRHSHPDAAPLETGMDVNTGPGVGWSEGIAEIPAAIVLDVGIVRWDFDGGGKRKGPAVQHKKNEKKK